MDLITYALCRGGGGGGTSGVVEGYYNPSDGQFYEDSAYTILVVGKSDYLYVSDDTNKLYRFDGTGYIAVADGGGSSIQVTVLPTASAAQEGKIYQYIGGTTLQYINGCFYKCVPGLTLGTYEWIGISVEDPSTYEQDPIDFNRW